MEGFLLVCQKTDTVQCLLNTLVFGSFIPFAALCNITSCSARQALLKLVLIVTGCVADW